MKQNKPVFAMVITIVIVAFLVVFNVAYELAEPTILGDAAVMQLQDSDSAYAQSQFIGLGGAQMAINLVGLGLVGLTWLATALRRMGSKASKNYFVLFALLTLVGLSTTGCIRPYGATIIEEIQPNETAFVVPLTGSTSDQGQFQSIEYLEDKQVATKRIEIEPVWHQTGRMNWMGEWLPSAKVIRVDRSPITREWVSADDKGTSISNQAFGVESLESIDFEVGAVVSALVEEENAATFLYYFSGRSLDEIMDKDVRGFIQAGLFDEYGVRSLREGQTEKKSIFDTVCENTIAKFQDLGITITACGGSEGLIYTDQTVQSEINANFKSQQARIRAEAEKEARKAANETLILNANADAEAALIKANAEAEAIRIAGQAEADVLEAIGTQLAKNPDLVNYEIAQKSKGDVPSTFIFSGDSSELPFPLLLDMGQDQASNK